MKQFLLILCVLFYPAAAMADVIPVEFTDKVYSDGIWYPHDTANRISIGNKDGLAWRFSLAQSYTISNISGFMAGLGVPEPDLPIGTARLHIISGSLFKSGDGINGFYFPSGNEIFRSEDFKIPTDDTTREYSSNVPNLELPTGDYWVRASGSPAAFSQIEVSDIKLHGTVTTPEPASILLLSGGLLAAGFRRYKKNKTTR